MRKTSKIVTVGFSPAWDIRCVGEGLEWGEHKEISEGRWCPAGKAFNVSRALAWMGEKNTAAGLWGRESACGGVQAAGSLGKLIKVRMTTVEGATRRNITVVDRLHGREMHLRSKSKLASAKALRKLKADLGGIVNRNSICVFAGAMPGGRLLADALRIVKLCRERAGAIVVDTYGPALKRIVNSGGVFLIKPNVEELGELLGLESAACRDSATARRAGGADRAGSLARAGRRLLGKVEVVLISRGRKGAVAVTSDGAWEARYMGAGRQVLSTVGCGDYLLGGFLKGLKESGDVGSALGTAVKVGTAKAWDLTEEISWRQAGRKVKVQVRRI